MFKRNTILQLINGSNDGLEGDASLDSRGRIYTTSGYDTPTTANVATSTSNATLSAADVTLGGRAIANDSAAILYVKFGATASSTSYTVAMAAGAYYEVPFWYRGRIDGILSTGTGSARVTEVR